MLPRSGRGWRDLRTRRRPRGSSDPSSRRGSRRRRLPRRQGSDRRSGRGGRDSRRHPSRTGRPQTLKERAGQCESPGLCGGGRRALPVGHAQTGKGACRAHRPPLRQEDRPQGTSGRSHRKVRPEATQRPEPQGRPAQGSSTSQRRPKRCL